MIVTRYAAPVSAGWMRIKPSAPTPSCRSQSRRLRSLRSAAPATSAASTIRKSLPQPSSFVKRSTPASTRGEGGQDAADQAVEIAVEVLAGHGGARGAAEPRDDNLPRRDDEGDL